MIYKSETILADCMDILPTYPDNRFDLAIPDIPYGINVGKMAFTRERKNTVKQKNGNRLNANRNKKIYQIQEWDNTPPTQTYFDELKRISKHQIIWGIEYTNWTGVGKGRIIWDKGVPDGLSFKRYEVAYCSMIDYELTIPLLWSGMQQAKSLSEPMTPQGNKKLNEKRIHICHKPIMLYDKIFLEFGFNGMTVIDTHLGGGSSRISADKFGVSEFVGIEINKNTFEDQEKRWHTYKKQYALKF